MNSADPGCITDLLVPPDNPGRRLIVVGEVCVTDIDERAASDLGLAIGVRWTDELAERAEAANQVARARTESLRRLSHGARSSATMRRELLDGGHEEDAAASAINRLETEGLLDDPTHARRLAERRGRNGTAGAELLIADLLRHGIDEHLAQRTVDTVLEARDAIADATAYARRKVTSMRPARRRERLYGQLRRRGWDDDTVDAAIRAVLGDEDFAGM